MKKSDYGTLKTVIELRENGIIIDGPLNVRVLRGLSEFTEKVIPGGLMDPTPEDNQNGGFVIVPPKEGKKLGRGIDALFPSEESEKYRTAFSLIQKDPHSWSVRRCPTCRAITELIGRPFGCDLFRKERSK